MRVRALWGLAAAGALALAAGCGSSPAAPPLPDPDDFAENVNEPRSCALDCSLTCAEGPAPWKCPALADYASIPHDPVACGAFDGKTWPKVVNGVCAATLPTGDALAKTSLTTMPVVLPDGRRLAPAGNEWRFLEPDMPGGFPSYSLLVPGTSWLVVEDTGYDMHSVRIVDTQTLLAGGASPVVSSAKFPQPKALNWGLAYVTATSTLYVASGVPDSKNLRLRLRHPIGRHHRGRHQDHLALARHLPRGHLHLAGRDDAPRGASGEQHLGAGGEPRSGELRDGEGADRRRAAGCLHRAF